MIYKYVILDVKTIFKTYTSTEIQGIIAHD